MSAGPLESLLAVGAAAWPAALTLAVAIAHDRWRWVRRRRTLNERLHELRRPLQALVLAAKATEPATGPDPLELALAALRDLDRELNGGRPDLRRRPVQARLLAVAAAERWRVRAASAGRRIGVRWRCGADLADADPVRVSQALDNLIANALEHGSGPITIEGARRAGAIELIVRDRGPASRSRARGHGDPRRGHGLRVSRALAKQSGGALRMRSTARGTVAALELPLARR